MNKRSYRVLQHLLYLLTFFVIATSFYLQYMTHLQPCPLCLMQRGCAFLFVICCLIAMRVASLRAARCLIGLQILSAGAGLFFALRQLWLQSLPADKVPACLPSFDVLLQYFPWPDIVSALFWGTGSCAEMSWTFLGLSLAAWSGLYFLTLVVVSLYAFILLGTQE